MHASIEQWEVAKCATVSDRGVVAAQHRRAAEAGAAMMARGGNAVDAAVACAFALGVLEPWNCGLGGSGYMVVWSASSRRGHVLDFQGALPGDIRFEDYPLDPSVPYSTMGFPGVRGRRNVVGYGSITVPGAVAGLSRALARFGTVGLDTALQPATELADQGLPLTWWATLNIALAAADLREDPAARETYLPGGLPPPPEGARPLGTLARTLRQLAEEGADSFYSGALAEALAGDLQRGGSRLTAADFVAYEVLEHEPLTGQHRGVDLLTAGPTSGGPRLIEAMSYVAEHLEPHAGLGPRAWSVYADALNRAWRAHKERTGLQPQTGGCTSHLSAVDADGNMVALTYTLLNRFGSAVVLPSTGILMNNAVSYFDPRPGFPTSLEPRKRINSSNMCPTVGVRDGEAIFALGASGANQIMPCVMLHAAMMLDFDMSLEAAFNMPRLDAGDRASVRVDPALGPEVLAELADRHELEVAQRLVFPKLYGCPSGVSRDPATGRCAGINDPSLPVGGAAAAGDPQG